MTKQPGQPRPMSPDEFLRKQEMDKLAALMEQSKAKTPRERAAIDAVVRAGLDYLESSPANKLEKQVAYTKAQQNLINATQAARGEGQSADLQRRVAALRQGLPQQRSTSPAPGVRASSPAPSQLSPQRSYAVTPLTSKEETDLMAELTSLDRQQPPSRSGSPLRQRSPSPASSSPTSVTPSYFSGRSSPQSPKVDPAKARYDAHKAALDTQRQVRQQRDAANHARLSGAVNAAQRAARVGSIVNGLTNSPLGRPVIGSPPSTRGVGVVRGQGSRGSSQGR